MQQGLESNFSTELSFDRSSFPVFGCLRNVFFKRWWRWSSVPDSQRGKREEIVGSEVWEDLQRPNPRRRAGAERVLCYFSLYTLACFFSIIPQFWIWNIWNHHSCRQVESQGRRIVVPRSAKCLSWKPRGVSGFVQSMDCAAALRIYICKCMCSVCFGLTCMYLHILNLHVYARYASFAGGHTMCWCVLACTLLVAWSQIMFELLF